MIYRGLLGAERRGMPVRRYDMHCHLDFFADSEAVIEQIAQCDDNFLSVTVTPRDYERTTRLFESSNNVRVALGLHPWWVADGRCDDGDTEAFEAFAKHSVFVGEVGLDFGKRCSGTEDIQRAVFDRIARSCANGATQVISIHAVKAENEIVEALGRAGCLDSCACILHWFSGSSEQLAQAIKAGCYFSVGPRMLASKRGREYVKAIPRDKLLLETDAPSEPSSSVTFQSLERLLEEASVCLDEILDEGVHQYIERTSATLFGVSKPKN